MTATNFIDNLEVLNAETHKNYKLAPLDKAEFAEKWSNTQVLPSEFPQVCRDMPIIFAKNAEGDIEAVVAMAVKDSQNLFLQDGKWTGNYMPATLRQYPFILARANKDATDYALCFDKTAKCIGAKIKGEALFDKKGEQTETTKNLLNFFKEVQKEVALSDLMVKKLAEFDLFKDIEGHFELGNGEKITLRGMRIVDEDKLKNLEAEKVAELNKSGLLFLIHTHLLSLGNFNQLMQRYLKTKATDAA